MSKEKKDNAQHNVILKLRLSGCTYNEIAEILSISKNTVQSICQRAGIKCTDITNRKDYKKGDFQACKWCGKLFENPWNRKGKAFCSDQCRTEWWNEKRRLNPRKTGEEKIP